ncbi:MAG: BNR repeat-containing protein [Planctomycetes bacterium]|nr:BNR repeat-containing protein [Planctomycetota bacterium]
MKNREQFQIQNTLNIAEVPSWFPVGFCLRTCGDRQYVGYYDTDHRMTVACRELGSSDWQYQVLPSRVGWDSHNYITMTADSKGYLHLSGNMHSDPLIYFRSKKPWDIEKFERIGQMTGEEEDRCTYPEFMRDAQDRLVFHYRIGGSGNGNEIYNVYDPNTMNWERLLDEPLTDGQGKMNAYAQGPLNGPDDFFHLAWVWRDTPDCATNHHLSYARSPDLIHWESARGEPCKLPITLEDKSLWVDPIPGGGGIINSGVDLTFDHRQRPIITYHKSDRDGNMQIYATRFEDGEWVQHQLTDWGEPIEFSGTGSMGFIGIRMSALKRLNSSLLFLHYRHRNYGKGYIIVDEDTLQPTGRKINIPDEYPEEMNVPENDWDDIEIRRTTDNGSPEVDGIRYVLQWETLPSNHDQSREEPLPEPSMLRLCELSLR